MALSPQALMWKQRLETLQIAVNEYYLAEKTRLTNEVEVLKAILDGRTAGKGIQRTGVAGVSRAVYTDLASYLKGS